MAAKVPAQGPQRHTQTWHRSRSCLALTLLLRHQDNTPNSLLRQTPNPSPFLPPDVHNRSPVETFGPFLCSPILFTTTKTQQLHLYPIVCEIGDLLLWVHKGRDVPSLLSTLTTEPARMFQGTHVR